MEHYESVSDRHEVVSNEEMQGMIVVGLIGGLGNQMFQYAAARALADRYGAECTLDVRDFTHYKLHSFGLARLSVRAYVAETHNLKSYPSWQKNILRKIKKYYQPQTWYFETSFSYDRSWESLPDNIYLDGYFQSEKYFRSITNQLRMDFVPRNPLSDKNKEIASSMTHSDSVMIHVRRGDYVKNSKTLQVHGVCSLQYYIEAISIIAAHVAKPKYFVFSDDINWARENLPLGHQAQFIEGNASNPEIDLHLMSYCHHHIIANSSFSWWGAWLGQHLGQIVIAPDPWFDKFPEPVTDLIPETWRKIAK